MWYLRILLVVLIALPVTLSGAMDAAHTPVSQSDHAMMDAMTGDAPACCDDGTERVHSCHVLAALCPSDLHYKPFDVSGEDVHDGAERLPAGIQPPVLPDPLRMT